MSETLLKVAYAILDKKGRVVFNVDAFGEKREALIYAKKQQAAADVDVDEGETVVKVKIVKDNRK